MLFRELKKTEIIQIWDIDRSEYIETIYIQQDKELIEKRIDFQADGWAPNSQEQYFPILLDCYQRNGYFLGCFKGEKLVGIIVLESKWIGSNQDTLQLKFFHIDKSIRSRGIGRVLFDKVYQRAKELQAKKLYVSSIENKKTVDLYQHLGFRLTDEVDEELYELEPNDIHMELIIE